MDVLEAGQMADRDSLPVAASVRAAAAHDQFVEEVRHRRSVESFEVEAVTDLGKDSEVGQSVLGMVISRWKAVSSEEVDLV